MGEAISLQQKVVDARSRILGSYHADALWSMNSLALVLKDLSRKDEGEVKACEGPSRPDSVLGQKPCAYEVDSRGSSATRRNGKRTRE